MLAADRASHSGKDYNKAAGASLVNKAAARQVSRMESNAPTS